MTTLDTDDNNDIFLSGNSLAFVYDVEAVAKVAENVLLTQKGELEYGTTRGIPWFETIFTSIRNIQAWKANMISSLKKVSEVTGIKSFEYSTEDNAVEFRAKINTTYGGATVNV